MFGLELIQAQYERGTSFISGVTERASDSNFHDYGKNKIFLHPLDDAPDCGLQESTYLTIP